MASLTQRLADFVTVVATKLNALNTAKEDKSNKSTTLTPNNNSTYPTTAAVKAITDGLSTSITQVSGNVSTLTTTINSIDSRIDTIETSGVDVDPGDLANSLENQVNF